MRHRFALKPHPHRIAKRLYWDRAWSLVKVCTPVSAGCGHCRAAHGAHMRASNTNPWIQAVNEGLTCDCHFNGFVRVREDRLELPLKNKKPWVCSIWTDLFHESVPEPFTDQFHAGCPQHLFLGCNKCPENIEKELYGHHPEVQYRALAVADHLQNLWLRFTTENQEWFARRWKYVRQIPASVLFVSHEPALGLIVYPDFLERGNGAWILMGARLVPKPDPCTLTGHAVRGFSFCKNILFTELAERKAAASWMAGLRRRCQSPL
jgi:protein gp37